MKNIFRHHEDWNFSNGDFFGLKPEQKNIILKPLKMGPNILIFHGFFVCFMIINKNKKIFAVFKNGTFKWRFFGLKPEKKILF